MKPPSFSALRFFSSAIPVGILALVVLLSLVQVRPAAAADVAPPSQPPGTNPIPGSETTQVRMLAETVLLDVQKKGSGLGTALVTASFTLRNLGGADEHMDVRFPLSFWNGESDGFSRYPEIADLKVKVNGVPAPTHRVTTPNDYVAQGPPIPWAAFPVDFPAGKDIRVEIKYTSAAFGEYPNVAYRYVLETGAGWKDTIGSADLIVRLPYLASEQNIILEGGYTGFSETTPGGVISGSEIRWHYDDLEPARENNLKVSLVMPEAWQKVLDWCAAVQKNPNDGEAWGQLGKIYKEIIELRKGLREDAGAKQLYDLGQAAYQRSVELLPKDALWHLGYADLLWQHYFWGNRSTVSDAADLSHVLNELRISLSLSPKEQKPLDMLDWIEGTVPGAVQKNAGGGYDFLGLTATPEFQVDVPPTDTPVPSATSVPADTLVPTPLPAATDTPVVIAQVTRQAPTALPVPTQAATATNVAARLPICGGAIILPLFLAVWLKWRRFRVGGGANEP